MSIDLTEGRDPRRNAELKTRYASALLNAGNREAIVEARDVLADVTSTRTTDARALYLLAEAERRLGNYQAAEGVARRLIAAQNGRIEWRLFERRLIERCLIEHGLIERVLIERTRIEYSRLRRRTDRHGRWANGSRSRHRWPWCRCRNRRLRWWPHWHPRWRRSTKRRRPS